MKFNLRARLTAEFLGSAFLLAAMVGSGIMGERLAAGNGAIALLANTIATGAVLVAVILAFGPISGAHFNPAVTLADAMEHGIPWLEAVFYMLVQCAGGVTGAIVAHLMFGLRWYSLSSHARHGWSQVLSEFVATFGLLSVIWGFRDYAREPFRSPLRATSSPPTGSLRQPRLQTLLQQSPVPCPTRSREFKCQMSFHSSRHNWRAPWPRPSCFGRSQYHRLRWFPRSGELRCFGRSCKCPWDKPITVQNMSSA